MSANGAAKRCVPVCAGAVALLLCANLAFAHAQFEAGSPAPGDVLDSSPATIELRFNEPVEPVAVQVIDASGRDWLAGATAQSTDRHVKVQLPVPLEPGSYLLSYRVISGDAHVIASAYGFVVGEQFAGSVPVQPAAVAAEAGATLRVVRVLYISVLLAASGSALFLVLVGPAPPLRGWVVAATRNVAIAGGLLVVAYALVAGFAIVGPAQGGLTRALTALSGTSLAASLGVALVGFIIVALSAGAGRASWLIAAVCILCVSRALTGHPASREPAWLLQPAMVVHVACAGFWLGSLPPLWRACTVSDSGSLARLLERFSAVALVAVVALAFAGLMMALTHLAAPAALVETAYGRLLSLKLLGFAGLLGIAAGNKLRLTPAIDQGMPGAIDRLRRSVVLEAAVMLAVVVLSTLLASTAPERRTDGRDGAARPWVPGGLSVESASGGYQLRWALEAHASPATAAIEIFEVSGASVAPVDVAARASMPAVGIDDVELEVNLEAGAPVVIDLSPLAIPGRWAFTVEVFVTDFDKETFEFELERLP